MKKISKILLSSAVCTSLAYGVSFEYPQIYKDQKTMAMGGASVSAGGTVGSLFSNPAGLSKIPKSYGWEVDVFNVNVSTSENTLDFLTDLSDIDDSLSDDQQSKKTFEILEKNLGENLNINVSLSALSVAKHFEKYAFGFMPVSGVNMNLIPHRGNGTDGLLEANGLAYGGIAFGVSRKMDDIEIGSFKISNLNVGIGVKALQYQAFNTTLDTDTIVREKDDLGEYLIDEVATEGTSTSFDLGAQAQIYDNVDVGLSIMNIGTIGDSKSIEVPMTVNAGVSYTLKYDRVYFDKVVLAADYIDITQEYKQDEDFMKRTRLGLNAHVLDGWFGSLSVQAGMYQGYPSYGADIRLSMLRVGFSSYAEEVGPESGKQEDRRNLVSLSFGW